VDKSERVTLLSKVGLFSGLTPAALDLVASIATEESHEKGTTIFSHGAVSDKLYIIMSGRVRISRDTSGMAEDAGMDDEALAVLNPGAVFGEMALLDDVSRTTDAHVDENCHLVVISREVFEDLLFLHKDLAYEVLWSMVKILGSRLRETGNELTFLSASSKF